MLRRTQVLSHWLYPVSLLQAPLVPPLSESPRTISDLSWLVMLLPFIPPILLIPYLVACPMFPTAQVSRYCAQCWAFVFNSMLNKVYSKQNKLTARCIGIGGARTWCNASNCWFYDAQLRNRVPSYDQCILNVMRHRRQSSLLQKSSFTKTRTCQVLEMSWYNPEPFLHWSTVGSNAGFLCVGSLRTGGRASTEKWKPWHPLDLSRLGGHPIFLRHTWIVMWHQILSTFWRIPQGQITLRLPPGVKSVTPTPQDSPTPGRNKKQLQPRLDISFRSHAPEFIHDQSKYLEE